MFFFLCMIRLISFLENRIVRMGSDKTVIKRQQMEMLTRHQDRLLNNDVLFNLPCYFFAGFLHFVDIPCDVFSCLIGIESFLSVFYTHSKMDMRRKR